MVTTTEYRMVEVPAWLQRKLRQITMFAEPPVTLREFVTLVLTETINDGEKTAELLKKIHEQQTRRYWNRNY